MLYQAWGAKTTCREWKGGDGIKSLRNTDIEHTGLYFCFRTFESLDKKHWGLSMLLRPVSLRLSLLHFWGMPVCWKNKQEMRAVWLWRGLQEISAWWVFPRLFAFLQTWPGNRISADFSYNYAIVRVATGYIRLVWFCSSFGIASHRRTYERWPVTFPT